MPLRYVSAMQAKSDENYKAGEVLVEKSYYSASVHCFYYSVLQKMKYVLCEACGIMSYKEQEERTKRGDSHTFLSREVASQIDNPRRRAEFTEVFNDMRRDRTKADYKNTIFSKADCGKVKEKTDRLNRILNKIER